MKIATIVGARPQFIKAAVVSKALAAFPQLQEILVHTGQHFDSNMSNIFFDQLLIPRPSYLLDIHGGLHGEMTGRMMIEVERVLLAEKPDRVLVYGDTNSTLAGALVAAKLHIPVAHVEAGLRSFDMRMPEEINRILTDQVSDLLFCPTDTAVKNLSDEGFGKKPVAISKVGDVMQDSAILFASHAVKPEKIEVTDPFVLATLHRAENTDDPERLATLIDALNMIHRRVARVVLPLHPRTRAAISWSGKSLEVDVIEPVGYLEMLWLLQRCGLVLTDSGGVQKEAYFFGKACVTMRDHTEWTELVQLGANFLVGASYGPITETVMSNFGRKVVEEASVYGGGKAANRIASIVAGDNT
ncbi:non-hydrolyzing UDP-N-acetylglucosamine 2-epimerase [Nitrobacteraceae bacterium UC4446_H13]